MEKKVGYPVLVEAVAQKGMNRPEYIELLRKVHRQKFMNDIGKNVSPEQVQSFEQKLECYLDHINHACIHFYLGNGERFMDEQGQAYAFIKDDAIREDFLERVRKAEENLSDMNTFKKELSKQDDLYFADPELEGMHQKIVKPVEQPVYVRRNLNRTSYRPVGPAGTRGGRSGLRARLRAASATGGKSFVHGRGASVVSARDVGRRPGSHRR